MASTDSTGSVKSPRTTRSQSISSDRTSLTGYGGLMSPPLSVEPDPAFIAASAASQIVTNDHDSRADAWFDQHGIEPSGETALVSPPALKLVNRFLDQLLFNFLSVSKSTSLTSLRPAVGEVLKTKLAKDAVAGADQELQEYLGGGEDEELLTFHNGVEPSGNWDLELVWKRTRLRCMVYSSLGDMEEEDEDFYTAREQLDGPPGVSNRFSSNPGIVSPAVAIFLTSILEFMGEQVLVVAGQSAYSRLRAKHEKDEREGTSIHGDIAERVVVEEFDMERVALDRTLGRLWRGWKKRIRSPPASISLPRSFSRESLTSQPKMGGAESVTAEEPIEETESIDEEETSRRPSLAAVLAEFEHAAAIPLPILSDEIDIREIEIPGLASHSDDEGEQDDSDDEDISPKRRPKSLVFFTPIDFSIESSTREQPAFLNSKSRKRSNSLPSPMLSPYSMKRLRTSLAKRDENQVESAVLDEENRTQEEVTAEVIEVPECEDQPENNIDEEAKIEHSESHGVVAGVIAGAAILGGAAVTGIAAIVNGKTAQAEPADSEEPELEEDVTEEPQILTSSRVSIGGRISPETANIPSRQSSIRSHSVHSLRLIDVTAPKSPSRSRDVSVDAADLIAARATNVSRSSSIHSPVEQGRVASPVSRGPTSSPIARNGSALSTRQAKHSTEDSIQEEKEVGQPEPSPLPAEIAGAMQGVDVNLTPPLPSDTYELPAEEKAAKTTKVPFVLAPAPASRLLHEIQKQRPSELNALPATNLTAKSVDETSPPPLTPLREMIEGALDSSDEGSAVTSNNFRTAPEPRTIGIPTVTKVSPKTDQSKFRSQPAPRTSPRSSPPRTSRDESSRKVITSAPQRQRGASGSSSSNASHKVKILRTSEESSHNPIENKGQSFEQLIRSDQTIQYTLTPQSMRDIESPDSPRLAQSTVFNDHRRPQSTRSHSSSITKIVTNSDQPKSPKLTKAFKPVSRPASNTGTKVRANAPQPRDARIDRDSIGDFAEFIRSTGPAHDSKPLSVHTHRGTNGTSRNVSGSLPRATEPTNVPRRAESAAGRSRLQAREATVSRGDSISDLIDFVRSGPQMDNNTHRIPRTVAPFRSTMDSDQMSGAVGGKAIDASLPDPRDSVAPSFESSVNSQSALLNSSKSKSGTTFQNDFDEPIMMPKRKTRRVKDPYAIDLSDDEDEFEVSTPRPKPIQEESLADFLRNVPPPPNSSPPLIYGDAPRPTSKNVKKKSSSQSFRSRFSRKDSISKVSNGNEPRISNSRNGNSFPNHTPIAAQYSTTHSSYEPPRNVNNYASQVDSARNKAVQKSYQPREAIVPSNRTNDLADFLRSEPPSSMQSQPQPFISQQKEEGAFQRMFGRRRVH